MNTNNYIPQSTDTTNVDQKHYYAFISHSSEDEKTAKWLCKQLEGYYIPTSIQKEYQAPKRLKPIFLYEIDLSKNVLKRALESELIDSQYLIVICSPMAAKSSHVNDEVMNFINSGRYDKIIPFIIDGTPFSSLYGNTEDECFPPALVALKGTEQELRGINLREEQKHRGSKKAAVIDVIATMLGVRIDVLWDRYKRNRIKWYCILGVLLLLFCLLLAGIFSRVTELNHEKQRTEKELNDKNVEQIANQVIELSSVNTIESRKLMKDILPYADRSNSVYMPIAEKALRYACKDRSGQLKFENSVEYAEYSPTNRYLLAATQPANIYIYNAQTLDLVKVLNESAIMELTYATFTPDEKFIIAASDVNDGGKKISLFDVENRNIIDSLSYEAITDISVSTKHNQVAVSVYGDRKLYIYDISNNGFQPSGSIEMPALIISHEYLHEIDRIAIATEDGRICLWSLESQQCIGTLVEKTEYLEDISFHPKDKYLVGFNHNNKDFDSYLTRTAFCVWSTLNPNQSAVYNSHQLRVLGVTFDPLLDYEEFMSYGLDGKILEWNINDLSSNNPSVIYNSKSAPCFINSISFNTSTNQFLWVKDNHIYIEDGESSSLLSINDEAEYVHISMAPHHNYSIATYKNYLDIRNIETEEYIARYNLPDNILAAEYLDENHIIITTNYGFNILDGDENYYELMEREGDVSYLSYLYDAIIATVIGNRYIVYVENEDLGEEMKKLWIYDFDNKQLYSHIFDDNISTLSNTHSKSLLSVTLEEGTICIYDCEQRKIKEVVSDFANPTYSDDIKTSISDQYLVIYGFNKNIYLYDLHSKTMAVIENMHKDGILSVDISNDNTMLLTSSYHGDIIISDINTGVVLNKYDFHNYEDVTTIPLARFSYDDRYITFYSNRLLHYIDFKNYSELVKLVNE